MKKNIWLLGTLIAILTLSSCFGAKYTSMAGRGGEVVGVSGKSFAEPAPFGMVKVNRGFGKSGFPMGTEDSEKGCICRWILDG